MAGLPVAAPLDEFDPPRFGPYELLGRLGTGGMGTVYLGRREAAGPLVAIKVIRPDLADVAQFRRRFEREARAAQRVHHAYTAAVLDVNTTGSRPYLVTEYIEGLTLAARVRDHGPLSPANLEWLASAVAEALQAIHAAGVIHRDLKPANILLSLFGRARVIDFGIARATDETTMATQGAIGTPAFMAPEQIRNDEVTPAADIHAWGAVVVFAATGRSPFDGATAHTVMRQILEEEPDLEGLPDTLRAIVERALRKDPADRPTAAHLVDAIGALRPEPAEPTTPGTDATTTAGASAAPAAPAAASAGPPDPGPPDPARNLPTRAWPPRALPEDSTPAGPGGPSSAATAPWAVAAGPLPPPAPAPRRSRRRLTVTVACVVAVVLAAATGTALALTGGHGAADAHATGTTTASRTTGGATATAVASPSATVTAPRTPTGVAAGAAPAGPALTGPVDDVSSVVFSPDSRLLAAGSFDGTVRLWEVADPASAEPLGEPLPVGDSVGAVVFSPDGGTLAAGGGGPEFSASGEGAARLWDVSDPSSPAPLGRLPLGASGRVESLAFSPDGRTLATGTDDGTVRLWDASDPTAPRAVRQLPTNIKDGVWSVRFSPDGRTLAASIAITVQLWDVSDLASPTRLGEIAVSGAGGAGDAAFSSDGRMLAVGWGDGAVRLWDVADPASPKAAGRPLDEKLGVLAFAADSDVLATGNLFGGGVRLWDVTTPESPRSVGQPLAGPTAYVRSVAFSRDGRLLAAGGVDQKIHLWRLL